MTGRTFGPGRDRLLVDGRDVAAVHVATTHREKGRGLLGTDAVEGALWLDGASSVHMMGMRYAIDAAVLDRDGVVLHVATLRPWLGATRPRRSGRAVVEAPAGACVAWGVAPGSRLSVRTAG
ncbi:DUF192 domain-containing protein [Ornithinimicrobium pekingense]|uniref:DUF192 domain-containing protein n=1 Tax=Ornithinimicrobium pekingense TaxID=384677 RepID=A0ABQ2FBC7_9MICO|nr:DUF192 domain-containing protein [Ornithinimicrobium pekingense]GGK80381.1 hypothetical protein GCM10011509_31110 [Ornithinimicrobium pekingense]